MFLNRLTVFLSNFLPFSKLKSKLLLFSFILILIFVSPGSTKNLDNSFKSLIDLSLKVTFDLNSIDQLNEISKFLPENGETIVKINIQDKNENLFFVLENRRNIDRKTINLLRNKQISAIIN